jgi:hypothetical protein
MSIAIPKDLPQVTLQNGQSFAIESFTAIGNVVSVFVQAAPGGDWLQYPIDANIDFSKWNTGDAAADAAAFQKWAESIITQGNAVLAQHAMKRPVLQPGQLPKNVDELNALIVNSTVMLLDENENPVWSIKS